MAKLNLPQTKSSLRKIKEELAFAREGHDLLNQKREILALEVVRRLNEIRRSESGFLNVLNDLYSAYKSASLDMGAQEVTIKSCSERKAYALQHRYIRLMGLKLPAISLTLSPPAPPGGMAQTTASYDTARERSRKALEDLVKYAVLSKEIIVLARELRKVQRRVNALEKVYIPPREQAQKYIADRLEEMEREEVYLKKLVRQRMNK